MVSKDQFYSCISCINPNGAFYVTCLNISKLIRGEILWEQKLKGLMIANILLEKANVALVPGSGFGTDIRVEIVICYFNGEYRKRIG